ncbi:hypothetical protein AAFF_G00165770 [Aldrovandia affinis]|uniref:Uncharacterized protein n=1 Tax=Aldrovandia affinis TaxID=143900 RepID=A0AAD7W7A0_9TELE|nr:hypothetical protein AAFF_G00165770 [Aldrovandia affinis]
MTAGPARAKLYACSDHSRRTLRQLPLGPGQFSCPAAEQAPERRRQMSKAALRWDHPHTHMDTSWHSHQPSSGALQHSQAAVQPAPSPRRQGDHGFQPSSVSWREIHVAAPTDRIGYLSWVAGYDIPAGTSYICGCGESHGY